MAVMVGIVGLIGSARAAFVNYTIGSGGLDSFNITWDATTENALAGGILLTKVSGNSSMPGSFLTVCTDIGGTLFLGRTYGYSASTPFAGESGVKPTWGAGNAASLTSAANAAAAIQAAANIFFTHSSVLNGGSVAEKAALQLAVWETLYDTTAGSTAYALGSGRFKVNSGNAAAVGIATTWLGEVDLNASYTGYLLKPDPAQQYGLFGQEVFYDVTPVPEPTTVIAGALLLLPLVATMSRSRRRRPGKTC
jgi:hypothetical protein